MVDEKRRMPLLSPDGIGQSVLAGTRSESRRAGEWVRKASDDDW